jgi:hypothetical protein
MLMLVFYICIFQTIDFNLLVDLFPVHYLTPVSHHCIVVPLSESTIKRQRKGQFHSPPILRNLFKQDSP